MVKNLIPVKCCVNCTNWDEGHGDYKSTCGIDTDGAVFSPAHICDAWKVRENYWKKIFDG
jgi:hypothetical protein